MTQQKSKLAVKHMTSFAAVAGLVLALAPAAQAVTIITDDVEDINDYTGYNVGGWYIGSNDGSFRGMSPVAGVNVINGYSTNNGTRTGEITFTAGFGSGNLIQEGTYAFTISVGDSDWADRAAFEYFDHRLQTTSGAIELPNPDVTTPYVELTNDDVIAEWTTTTITYTVGAGDPLIGEEFTWAASFGHGSIPESYGAAGFDAVRIEFTPDSASDPEITSITSLGGGVFELTLKGENSTSYEFYSSATLDFTSGGTLVPLTGGGTDVTTDGSGDATVQMSLAGSANFVRAQ